MFEERREYTCMHDTCHVCNDRVLALTKTFDEHSVDQSSFLEVEMGRDQAHSTLAQAKPYYFPRQSLSMPSHVHKSY